MDRVLRDALPELREINESIKRFKDGKALELDNILKC